jgi:predicted amidophosphoribosyltransferase
VRALLDLVLPAGCAGCAEGGPLRGGLCRPCADAVLAADPQRVRPDPEPVGLPPTVALAAYGGALREALLAYKEKNRHALAAPLGAALATTVVRGLALTRAVAAPVVLVAVPDTAEAIRRRQGDHVVRLARRAARTLRAGGVEAAVAAALRARPRPDSAELGAAERAVAARDAFVTVDRQLPAVRAAAAAGARVVIVDDIVTTGSTLAAAAGMLAQEGVSVSFCGVLAATRRLHRS